MIPYQDFKRLLADVSECCDLDAYIAEVGGSVPLDDVTEVINILTTIWSLGNGQLTIGSIAAIAGTSLRQLALTYGLPYRTVQDWSAGARKPPEWQLPLIAYAVLSDHMSE